MRVKKTNIIGTEMTVYSVWEPYAGHSTFTFEAGMKLGRVGTRPLPRELEELPASPERCEKVAAWLVAQCDDAYRAILDQYPHTRKGRPDMGEILLFEHIADPDCEVRDGECLWCKVHHGEPCSSCGGRGYHNDDCPELYQNMTAEEAVDAVTNLLNYTGEPGCPRHNERVDFDETSAWCAFCGK